MPPQCSATTLWEAFRCQSAINSWNLMGRGGGDILQGNENLPLHSESRLKVNGLGSEYSCIPQQTVVKTFLLNLIRLLRGPVTGGTLGGGKLHWDFGAHKFQFWLCFTAVHWTSNKTFCNKWNQGPFLLRSPSWGRTDRHWISKVTQLAGSHAWSRSRTLASPLLEECISVCVCVCARVHTCICAYNHSSLSFPPYFPPFLPPSLFPPFFLSYLLPSFLSYFLPAYSFTLLMESCREKISGKASRKLQDQGQQADKWLLLSGWMSKKVCRYAGQEWHMWVSRTCCMDWEKCMDVCQNCCMGPGECGVWWSGRVSWDVREIGYWSDMVEEGGMDHEGKIPVYPLSSIPFLKNLPYSVRGL